MSAPICANCGHPESAHSDGLPDDPHRLCSLCRECEGFSVTPPGEDRSET